MEDPGVKLNRAFYERLVAPLVADGGQLGGGQLVDAEPDRRGGARLTLEFADRTAEVLIRPRSNGAALARSRCWELSIAGRDDQPRDVAGLEAVLRMCDDLDLDPVPERDRVADFALRVAPIDAEMLRFQKSYRPPRIVRALMTAAGTRQETLEAINSTVARLCALCEPGDRSRVRVCDVGAGPGVLVSALHYAGFKSAFGVDRLPEAVFAARAAGIPVRYGNARRLERIAPRLDVVTCVRVFNAPGLASAGARRLLLDGIARALLKGGELLVSGAGDLLVAELHACGLRRHHWPNPPLPGEPVHVFVKR